MIELKTLVLKRCHEIVAGRISTAQAALDAAQQAANDETKSSAGDKYETGRAMAQLAMEQNSAHLTEALKLRKQLEVIKPDSTGDFVQRGSLIQTDQALYFISVSVGIIDVDREKIAVISPESPIGALLMGKRVHDSFSFNGRAFKITGLW